MESFNSYTHQEIWDMLPLGKDQRGRIIEDFVITGKYDKIPEDKMKGDDMKVKFSEVVKVIDDEHINDIKKEKIV